MVEGPDRTTPCRRGGRRASSGGKDGDAADVPRTRRVRVRVEFRNHERQVDEERTRYGPTKNKENLSLLHVEYSLRKELEGGGKESVRGRLYEREGEGMGVGEHSGYSLPGDRNPSTLRGLGSCPVGVSSFDCVKRIYYLIS